MLNSSVHAASTAASTTGQVLGPAAGHHRVDRDLLDRALDEVGRHDRDDVVGRARRARDMRATRSTVGGTSGRPSLQPRAYIASASSSASPSSTRARAAASARSRATSRASTTSGSCVREPQPGRQSGRRRPRPSTPVNASHWLRSQPSSALDDLAVLDAQQRRHGVDVERERDLEVAVVARADAVGERRVVLRVDRRRRRASSASTGATSSHVGHARFTTATRPSGTVASRTAQCGMRSRR